MHHDARRASERVSRRWRFAGCRSGAGSRRARSSVLDGASGAVLVPPTGRVASAGKEEEASDGSDAVYLLTFVHDSATGDSLLSIVDGEEMEQVALLRVPERVPYGLHGHWVPEDELQAHVSRHEAR